MQQGSDAGDLGERVLEQLQPLGDQLRAEERRPCDISSRPGKAGDEPISDRIAHGRRDDRDDGVACRAARAAGVAPATMRSTLRRASSVARRGRRSSFPVGRPVLNENVLILHIAAFA
jgi:hypothetical protein